MIFFVDDERRRMRSYVEALESENFEVEFEYNVSKAVTFYEQNAREIELFILDVMLPSGDAFNNQQTDDGLRTGICLHDRIRDENPHIPIIIFTNINIDELSNVKSKRTKVLNKEYQLPFDLVEEVKKMLLEEVRK
jgi:CheY-like chemotaxis protein